MSEITNHHIPVLLDEVVDFLIHTEIPNDYKLNFFDGTLGGGGYSLEILKKAKEAGLEIDLVGGDLDPLALQIVNARMEDEAKDVYQKQKLTLREGNFAELIQDFEDGSLSGICLDLGFSSNQLAIGGRGFSYQNLDEPLDLRFEIENRHSCAFKLSRVKSAEDLAKTLYTYSGEALSRRIADKIHSLNKKTPQTVREMVNLVLSVIPPKMMKFKNSTLSRVWQALRIWTNDEFTSLENFLPLATKKLAIGGRLAIVSFHSLEDKIVTQFMRDSAKLFEADKLGNKTQNFRLLTTKPVLPSTEEVDANIRSRSGILRVLERVN